MFEELKALKLEKGGIYAIETKTALGVEGLKRLNEAAVDLGITFIVLGPNLKVARAEEERFPV